MKKLLWSSLLIFSYGYMLTMNILANSLPLNGKTTGQLSAEFPNYFVPAGVTFSIWGIIFLLLLIFVGISVVNLVKKGISLNEKSIYRLLSVNLFLNGTWILAWHYGYVLISFLIMLGLLISLILLHRHVYGSAFSWAGRIAVSVYLGWISVATAANFTTVLVDNNLQGSVVSQQIWASIMILVVLVLTVYMIFKVKDWFFPLVAIWACYGINLKQPSELWYSPGYIAWLAMVLLIVLYLTGLIRNTLQSR